MARILMVSRPGRGHLNWRMGIAERLVRTHELGWVLPDWTDPSPPEQIVAAGGQFLPSRGTAPQRPWMCGEEFARVADDVVAYAELIRGALVRDVPRGIDPLRQVFREYRPDVIVLDGTLYGAMIAAHVEQIPYAVVSPQLTFLSRTVFGEVTRLSLEAISREREELFAGFGLRPEFRTLDCVSPWLNCVFATPDLIGEDAQLPERTFLVGPAICTQSRGDETEFPWDRLGADRQIVYVSFGSQLYWQPELFAVIVEAVALLGAQLVLSVGELPQEMLPRTLPPDAIVVPYAPQPALLERASVFITHGGSNSIMEAIHCGVPMLVIPLMNDGPVNAHVVEQSGVGCAIDPRNVSVAGLREALASLLAPHGSHRQRAVCVRASYRSSDGAKGAVDRVAELASVAAISNRAR